MPSEYEIYRAYAGMNQPKSGFDYFMEGLKEIQAGARADKQLELQERSQDRADKSLQFQREQQLSNQKAKERQEKFQNMNLIIGNLNSDIAKAQTINSFFPDGEFSEAVESLNEAGVRKDSNFADFKDAMLLPENERMAGFASLLKKINYSEQPQLFNTVVDRYTKSEKSITDMNKEMMADPLFKSLVENDLAEIRNISQGIFDKNKYPGMDEQKAIESLMDRVKNRPLEYQEYLKEQREEFKTSIPEVEEGIEEADDTKEVMEGSDIGIGSAGVGLDLAGTEGGVKLGKIFEGAGWQPAGGDPSQPVQPEPLDKDYFIEDKSGLKKIVSAYKGKAELSPLEKASKEGSYLVPAGQDEYLAVKGGRDQLRDKSGVLHTLDRARSSMSKEEFDSQYKTESEDLKKSLKDMYALYLRLDPKGTEGVDKVKKAGGTRGGKYGGNQALRKMLSDELKRHKQVADRGKWSYYRFDPEIKKILDNILL